MPAIGGSIESVTLNGRIFPVAADAEVQRKLGGFENEIQPNGNPTARLIKTRVAWGLAGFTVESDDSRGDHEFLQALANALDFFPVAVTLASGSVYQGSGQITSELQVSTQNATAAFDLGGPGVLTPQ